MKFSAGFVVVVGIIGVLAHRKRKRESGTLWLPEGFSPNKKQRKDPIGQDDFQLQVNNCVFGLFLSAVSHKLVLKKTVSLYVSFIGPQHDAVSFMTIAVATIT